MSLVDHMLAFLFGLLIPLATALGARRREPVSLDSHDKIATYWANSAMLWLMGGAVALGWWWQGRSLDRLGLAPPGWSAGAAATVAVCVALVGLDTWHQIGSVEARRRTRARWRRDTPFMPETRHELAHAAALAISAGICEELVFRGFLIRYLAAMLGETPGAMVAAVGVPAIIFGVAHAYQGPLRSAKIALLAVLFGVLFLQTSSLVVVVALHAGLDLAMSALGVRLMAEERQAGPEQQAG